MRNNAPTSAEVAHDLARHAWDKCDPVLKRMADLCPSVEEKYVFYSLTISRLSGFAGAYLNELLKQRGEPPLSMFDAGQTALDHVKDMLDPDKPHD